MVYKPAGLTHATRHLARRQCQFCKSKTDPGRGDRSANSHIHRKRGTLDFVKVENCNHYRPVRRARREGPNDVGQKYWSKLAQCPLIGEFWTKSRANVYACRPVRSRRGDSVV